jgi:hypothetical protein
MKRVLSTFNSLGEDQPDCAKSALNKFFDGFRPVGSEGGQDEFSGGHVRWWPPYSKSHPHEVSGLQAIDNRSDASMSSVTAPNLYSHTPLSKIQIIVDDNQSLSAHSAGSQYRNHRGAAEVHVRLGLYQKSVPARKRQLTRHGFSSIRAPVAPMFFSKRIHHHESQVVTVVAILLSRVSQTDNYPFPAQDRAPFHFSHFLLETRVCPQTTVGVKPSISSISEKRACSS